MSELVDPFGHRLYLTASERAAFPTTAWRDVKAVMTAAGIEGPQASPKGLRHGYGVAAIGAAVPLNMLSKWMGHAAIETTAIYANALDEEQRSIAERMWR